MAVVISGVRYVGAAIENAGWRISGFLRGFDGIGDYYTDAFAEAVIMNLGEHGLLFGLIFPPEITKSFDARRVSEIFAESMPPDLQTQDAYRSGTFFRHLEQMTGEYVVTKERWPALVRFENIRDPKSAQIIKPEQMSTVYGPNSYIDGASVEITRDPVTEQIDQVLPWLSQVKGAFSIFNGPADAAPDTAKLTSLCFRLRGEPV